MALCDGSSLKIFNIFKLQCFQNRKTCSSVEFKNNIKIHMLGVELSSTWLLLCLWRCSSIKNIEISTNKLTWRKQKKYNDVLGLDMGKVTSQRGQHWNFFKLLVYALKFDMDRLFTWIDDMGGFLEWNITHTPTLYIGSHPFFLWTFSD